MYRILRLTAMLVFSIIFSNKVTAQYGNEWINFDQDYFKFKIGKDGIYRISSTTLSSIGLGAVPGSQFTIYRNGSKIPIYVSNNGTLGSSDYVEFYAYKNDGTLETGLYNNPSWQSTNEYSLITDTATYFLTYSIGTHPRFSTTSVTIPTPTPEPQEYFWYTVVSNNGIRPNVFLPGRSYRTDYLTYKSTFDIGEGYILNLANTANPRTSTNPITIKGLFTTVPLMSKLNFSFTNGTLGASTTRFYVGSNLKDETIVPSYGTVQRNVDVETSMLTATTNIISKDDSKRGGFNIIKIEYPRTSNFSGFESSITKFKNNETASPLFYQFTNVPNLGSQPVLYNLTTNSRYVSTSSGSTVAFYLPASSTRQDFMFTGELEITSITQFEPVTFVDYSLPSIQGEYVLLSHSGYINDPSDPIKKYGDYRSSADGGNRQVTIVDVVELYDQFNYGAEFNPMAIRKFLKYANDTWTIKPKTMFIIGKGLIYSNYKTFRQNPSAYDFEYVIPTFGHPGSDNSLVDLDLDDHPDIEIGRLSAWSVTEINKYLDKVKKYEQAINSTDIPNLENSLWKKSALHIAGGNLDLQTRYLVPALLSCEQIFADSFYGGFTTTIKKTAGIEPGISDNEKIQNALNNGVSRMTFYGHAYATGFDYNLNEPDLFNASPKFPIFYAMGCDVAQIFGFTKTVGEHYLNSENGGSVAIIASNNYGYVGYLNNYLKGTYQQFAFKNFGKTLGTQFHQNIVTLPGSDDLLRMHKQCILLQGDPGLASYNPQKTDYYTDNTLITPSKNPLSTADTVVDIKVKFYNLGKVIEDSAIIVLEHKKPNGDIVYHNDTFRSRVISDDSVLFRVSLNPISDIGQNIITVRINPGMVIDEISSLNNTAVINLFMKEDVLRPVYPYDFSIVHKLPLELRASALSAFDDNQDYVLQIDTTERFNSPLKQETSIKGSIGGVVKWKPTIAMKDSTVYYWRTAVASTVTDSTNWQYSSFVYLANGSDGWNQSHFYQYDKNRPYTSLTLTEEDRQFKFSQSEVILEIRNRIVNPENNILNDSRTLIDNNEIDRAGCNFTGTIRFILIDTLTLKPIPYNPIHNSIAPCISGTRNHSQFEFQMNTAAWRKRAADFISTIPDGYYVIIYNFLYDFPGTAFNPNTLVTNWTADDGLYGETNTLKYKLKEFGFDQIDSFNRKRVFVHLTKTGDPAFEDITMFSEEDDELLLLKLPVNATNTKGQMRSVTIGPGENWQTLKWQVSHPESTSTSDSVYFQIEGFNSLGEWVSLYSGQENDLNLSPIISNDYNYVRLKWDSKDTVQRTSAHLDYWRVLYDPLPEAALNPIAQFVVTGDSVMQGAPFELKAAIENISDRPMDSMLVKFSINKADGTNQLLDTIRYKKLAVGDTIHASLKFDPRDFVGANTIIMEANPYNDQPEHFHPNNLGYWPLFVIKDNTNPVLDVTFDGYHILDKDIVSSKPLIKIMMRDENSFALLQDTSLMQVKLLRPGKTVPEDVILDGITATLYPATDFAKNEMYIEFTPELKDDGEYKLIVSGKDVSNNIAGSSPDNYEISFVVENKPSVSYVMNYPNPFSTSTAFVFTLTGSKIPDQFKIQIMTVTGKIVKEITKQELGPLRIGRNITEYKWDGRDEFGQLLGNGVYIYRVVVTDNGDKIEHRQNHEIDKYFNKKGYGKMYIMR